MRNVLRSYCVFVLLGEPKKNSFRTLIRFCRRAKLLWLAPRVPFWARWLGVCTKPMPKDETLLLWELKRLSESLEGKVLSLIPLSPEAARFVRKNRAQLEISYRLERSPT